MNTPAPPKMSWPRRIALGIAILILGVLAVVLLPKPIPLTAEQTAYAETKAAEATAAAKIAAAQRAVADAAWAAENNERHAKIAAQVDGEFAVRAMLKDPDSAQFDTIKAYRLSNGRHIACGRVNAKNGFGGYNGFKRFVSGGTPATTGIEGSMPGFADAWAMCR